MPINELIDFCFSHYDRKDQCIDCVNSEECQGGCLKCLEYIHQVNTKREFNCPNITFCYTCHHIHRYSTEIEYLLNKYVAIFKNTQQIRLWSIGCGPCSELFGLYNFKINNKLPFDIDYKGFDLNKVWNPIHEKIHSMNYFSSEFHYEDFFEYVQRTDEQPNMLILNYVLSDILRTNKISIDTFISDFCSYVNDINKCVVIVNDINLGETNSGPRYYYKVFDKHIRAKSEIMGKIGCFHFVNNQAEYFRYGTQHENNIVQIIPPENIKVFNPWMECRSAQLFIIKQPKQ